MILTEAEWPTFFKNGMQTLSRGDRQSQAGYFISPKYYDTMNMILNQNKAATMYLIRGPLKFNEVVTKLPIYLSLQ